MTSLLQVDIKLPAALYISWEADDAGLTAILEDLRALPQSRSADSGSASSAAGLRHSQSPAFDLHQVHPAASSHALHGAA